MDYGLNCEKYNTSRKNIRESLQDLGLAQEFLNTTPKAQIIKGQIDKLDFVKN